jgi:hypothetical protein
LAFFPFAFCALTVVALLSGVGGVLHIIRYDLIPLYRKLFPRSQTVASESQRLIK